MPSFQFEAVFRNASIFILRHFSEMPSIIFQGIHKKCLQINIKAVFR
jgi:hypothetical protein